MQISQTLPLLFALSTPQPLLFDVSLCQNFLTQSYSVIGQFVKPASFETGNIAHWTHLTAFRRSTGEGKVCKYFETLRFIYKIYSPLTRIQNGYNNNQAISKCRRIIVAKRKRIKRSCFRFSR